MFCSQLDGIEMSWLLKKMSNFTTTREIQWVGVLFRENSFITLKLCTCNA